MLKMRQFSTRAELPSVALRRRLAATVSGERPDGGSPPDDGDASALATAFEVAASCADALTAAAAAFIAAAAVARHAVLGEGHWLQWYTYASAEDLYIPLVCIVARRSTQPMLLSLPVRLRWIGAMIDV